MAKVAAIVTLDREAVGGGAPIFVEQSREQQEKTAFLLEKILDASVHDLKNGILVLVKHGDK
ncbi:hypothetical protein DNH61_23100 [Paenibacillus sambharensis]|uniref:Uncharacterized protein n=1 Tax=Paenibacillus sambharensis TaxID=1803190 RepID=A0A2W1LNX0_9BACL|nr:hypothetical protein [Paenibacillus sambharensis]PZD93511.1 hypothetical protein DNH61_23100 [Paenibacillus sambharensis]